MKVYHSIDDFIPPAFPVVTTGTFDGVHLGHLEIINRVTQLAQQNNGESVVVSFHPHPRTVIHPNVEIKLIQTIEEKIVRLEKAGIDHFVIIPFTQEFSRNSSLDFVRDFLIKKLQAKMLVIGYDHQFGRNREGSITQLQEFSTHYSFTIEQIQAQTFDNINISSTKIRAALQEGDIETANALLGYEFVISGTVVHGQKLGTNIGFPTANIDIHNMHKLVPATGVYAVKVWVDGSPFQGMLNLGSKPTVSTANKESIEVHIFDFDQRIYGKEIQVHFVQRMRNEQKFASLPALIRQLQKDKKQALQLLNA